ncbi:MAG: hypothetical protein ACJAXX_003208 [Roseivirga sp.]|jgi:hypothetical protein
MTRQNEAKIQASNSLIYDPLPKALHQKERCFNPLPRKPNVVKGFGQTINHKVRSRNCK